MGETVVAIVLAVILIIHALFKIEPLELGQEDLYLIFCGATD